MACQTKLVQKEEIQVSELGGSRFLILLPEGLDPETFINATPQDLWDEGLSFQPWSPLEGASISIPAYKVLLRLVGLPPHICREKHIRNAIARFGVFIGTVEPENPSSIASLLVAVGVDDLTLVPPQLVLHIGGMMYYVQVYTEAYHRAPIYTAEDMPKHPKVFKRPQPPLCSSSSDAGSMNRDLELIPMSTQELREICRGRTADSLSPELRRFATMDVIDMPDPCMATQNIVSLDPQESNQNALITAQVQLPLAQRSPDRMRQNCVATHPVTATTQQQQTNFCHNQSSADKSADAVQQSTVNVLQRSQQNSVAGNVRRPLNPPQQQIKRIQPQRILQRGESSMPPVNQISTARIPRRILPSQTDNAILLSVEVQGTALNAPPTNSDPMRGIHVDRAPNSKIILQPKNKGLALGPTKGPLSTKYFWNKPTARKALTGKMVLNQKRKLLPKTGAGPSKRTGRSKKDQAQVSFNPEGFYEVKVSYEHVSRLAEGCGFHPKDVEAVINLDNE